MKKNTVRVYDTISKKIVEVEVSDEVRTHYNRTQWNIDDNNESFFKHEIQFSALIGGHENAFENFREFMPDYDIEEETYRKIFTERLYNCLKLLSESERDLIIMLFFENKTERECAEFYGVNQKNINKKKAKILCKLNKLLEK
ncbi:MAG: sigma-70 family RNA polymerase sigma factor [Ruminococcus sp.]|mgnify:CR=1 FL=1|nr:sigma-70 family RNA polymerase sigma factor [Ruminococcus sp.]